MGMSKTAEIKIEDGEPVAPPVEVVETTTVTQTPQGAGVQESNSYSTTRPSKAREPTTALTQMKS